MTVIDGPGQLDERMDGAALEKWSAEPALLGKGLGSVVYTKDEVVELPLTLAEPVVESGGLNNSCELPEWYLPKYALVSTTRRAKSSFQAICETVCGRPVGQCGASELILKTTEQGHRLLRWSQASESG